MKIFLSAYAGATAAMLALDAIWLSTMAERLYQPQLGDLLAKDFARRRLSLSIFSISSGSFTSPRFPLCGRAGGARRSSMARCSGLSLTEPTI
jgi:hypothetical protein